MKKLFSTFIAMVLMFSCFSLTVLADTNRALYSTFYSEVGTAYFVDPNKDAYILLSVSNSPDATVQILDQLDMFCSATDFVGLSVPGCDYVEFADKFYKYTNKGMQIDVLYKDAVTGDKIWEGTLSDGDIMYLGNDHPNGYRIYLKAHGFTLPWAQLVMLENVDWR